MISTPVKVLGLDLSLTATGMALPDGSTATIIGKSTQGDRRLMTIRNRIMLEVETHQPDVVIIEDLPKQAMGAGLTGMVQGVARELLITLGIPYVLVIPSSLKTYATGKGNAKKPELRMELYKRTGSDVADDNQCDAWWLRALGHDLYGDPILSLPQTHRRALDKVHPVGLPTRL